MWLLDCMQALLCTLILTLESALIISRNFFICFEALCNVCVYERDKSYKYLLKIAVKEHSLLIKVFAQFPTCSYNCLFSMLSFMPFLKQENLVSMKKKSASIICAEICKTRICLVFHFPFFQLILHVLILSRLYLCNIWVAWLPINTLSLPNLWLLRVICICLLKCGLYCLMHNLQMLLRYKLQKKSIILKAILLAHYSDLVYSFCFAKKYHICGGCKTIIYTDIWNKRLNCYIIF